MFLRKKCNDQSVGKKKRNSLSKMFAFSLCLCVMTATPVLSASAAEGEAATISTITSDGVTTVTSTLTSVWTFITSNPYLSFSVSVSVILAVVMIFKRLVGVARR